MEYWHPYDTPLGMMLAVADSNGLSKLRFTQAGATGIARQEELPPGIRDCFHGLHNWLDAYFAGKRPEWKPPLLLKGTVFQRRVWNCTAQVPYGAVISYGELARRVGSPGAARAVGAALGQNPALLLIPCHRVVGARGALGGYAGGVSRKRALLKLEQLPVSEPNPGSCQAENLCHFAH